MRGVAALLGRAAFVAVGLALTAPVAAVSAEPQSRADELWRFADPEITESSGLVVTDEHVITVNDSGDVGRVFTVSLETGRTVGVTRWSPDPRDVEALAPAGAGHVWVADIGDNLRRRDTVTLLRVPVGPGDRTVTPERYDLVYPGAATDAETLLAHPETGQLYVVTKNVFGGRVYAVPLDLDPDRPNRLTEVARVVGIATDGAFFPDGRHLVIRTYARAVIYRYPEFEAVTAFATPPQEQGEGIAVAADDEVYVSSEGVRSPFLRLRLPEEARAALAPAAGSVPAETVPPDSGSAPLRTSAPPVASEPPADPGEVEVFRRDPWQYLLGTLFGVVALAIFLWSLRRPPR